MIKIELNQCGNDLPLFWFIIIGGSRRKIASCHVGYGAPARHEALSHIESNELLFVLAKMPLLRGKPIKQHKFLKNWKDDQEVFYCELTNEIFEDYEDYCERVISCNCMIWTCAITGKGELTYQEALESEEKALKNIKDFAPELRTPVLYLASLTEATHFSEMADLVYSFVRNRYFLGESVQACFEPDEWSYAQVLNVIAPSKEEVEGYCKKMCLPLDHTNLPAELFKYELEEVVDDDDDDDQEVKILQNKLLPADRVRRMKGLYTKDKNRAYLKQFTEQRKNGTWRVKGAIIDKYGISTIEFRDIFVGEKPVLDKLNKPDLKQQTMKKFIVSNLSPSKNGLLKSSKKRKNKRREDPLTGVNHKEQIRQEKLELVRKRKEEKRAEKEKLDRFAKEWSKKREDLVCEDLKELPVPCPVDCRIPNHLFGEFAMILEFLNNFKGVLNMKDYFPQGLTFDLLERALTENELTGPFSDLLQRLLTSIFVFQEDEDDEVKRAASADISLDDCKDSSAEEALRAASHAAKWSRTYHNLPLSKLHLDAITVTDILRLHLLASGGRTGDMRSYKWRLQERGGYMNTDDPGLEFRRKEPEILKFLARNPVACLSVPDKIKVLSCLMNQILTYASVRDVIDERYEKVAIGRKEIKVEQILDGKREKELKMKRVVEKGTSRLSNEERQKQIEETARRQAELQRRKDEISDIAMGYQVLPLGQDRAYRRYWIFASLPGLYVEDDERWPGECLPQPTASCYRPAADEDDTMSYIRKLFEASGSGTGSDKENEGYGNQIVGSPKKKLLSESNCFEHKTPVDEHRALVCTANSETCSIHNTSIEKTRWLFFYKEDEIDDLIKNLNKRGDRESALREALSNERDRVLKNIDKCPVQRLNFSYKRSDKVIATRHKTQYDMNLRFPAGTPIDEILDITLRDTILDMEDKIFHGALGSLKVPNRKAWRSALAMRSYDCQDPHLTWPTKMTSQKGHREEEEVPSRPASPCSDRSHRESSEEPSPPINPEQPPVVRDLAMAVLQIARCILPKYFRKPLPYEEKRPVKLTAIERWELSLMHSTSLSQVYLHQTSLDSSIQWDKSLLHAKCKICRRGKDDVNMLLCDGCDCGFHLYCLKPKLFSIPEGDWFCPSCRPKEKKPIRRSSRRRLLEEDGDFDSDDEPLIKARAKRKPDDSMEEPRAKRQR